MGVDTWYRISRICSLPLIYTGWFEAPTGLKRSEVGVGGGLFPTISQDEPNVLK